MKKYFLLVMMAIFAISCSKKVEVKGKITGGSPLERIEFIEASGVATLPLTNIGVKPDGTFAGSFEAPKNGMYVMSYAGRETMIYLKKGQTAEITATAAKFPEDLKVVGDAKANNDFLTQTNKFLQTYSQKMNIQASMAKDEAGFVKDIKKIQTDLEKNIDETAAKTNADKEVVTWKKNDIHSGILTILPQYEMTKKQASTNPSFKMSKVFTDYEKSLQENKEELVKNHPIYRSYLLGTMTEDFQKYAMSKSQGKTDITTSEMFASFIKDKKELSQTAKDYLLAFVMAQSDIRPDSSKETSEKIAKIIDTDVKDANVKKDLKRIQFVVNGLKKGETAPDAALVTADGKAFKIAEGSKPKVIVNYASWTPYIKESTVPIMKQIVDFYKSKMDFVFVNMDDTKEQFTKTSKVMFAGIPGTNVYAEGGLNSDYADKYGIYGFKLAPSYLILDKDGKIAGRTFFNPGEQEFVALLDQLSGLKAPQVAPEATLQNDLLAPSTEQAPPPPPTAK